jgi:hypothetical protein
MLKISSRRPPPRPLFKETYDRQIGTWVSDHRCCRFSFFFSPLPLWYCFGVWYVVTILEVTRPKPSNIVSKGTVNGCAIVSMTPR